MDVEPTTTKKEEEYNVDEPTEDDKKTKTKTKQKQQQKKKKGKGNEKPVKEKKPKPEKEKEKTKEELMKELDPNSTEYQMLMMGFPVDFKTTKVRKNLRISHCDIFFLEFC